MSIVVRTDPRAAPTEVGKPLLRGWLHLLWSQLSLVAGTALVLHVPADERVVAGVYAASVTALFGASALYHRGSWGARAHAALQRVDHAMIFVLIAGSATPVFATTLSGRAAEVLLAAMWILAGVALVVHLLWMHAPELLVGSTYVGLGCIGALALPAVWVRSGAVAGVLIAAGGACYIAGALQYHRRRPNPWPTVFGYHEVFHTLVCAGATLHYVAIAGLIL